MRDANGNGQIDNVSEMFGNATTSGFAALRVWQDAALQAQRSRRVAVAANDNEESAWREAAFHFAQREMVA